MPISEAYNMDCMDYMAQFPDKHFELAIVDPPYGIGAERPADYARRAIQYRAGKTWDSAQPSADYFATLFRVSVHQVIWGGNYFSRYLPSSMGWVTWFKTREMQGRSWSECELAFTSFAKALRVVELRPFIGRTRIHPTQKPVALYKWILTNYAKPGDKILDTHLGSGSSRIAAWDLGFDFYATELDKDYFDAQEKRFADHIAQPNMFAQVQAKAEQTTLGFASDG